MSPLNSDNKGSAIISCNCTVSVNSYTTIYIFYICFISKTFGLKRYVDIWFPGKIVPNSHYRWYVLWLKVFLGGGTNPRLPNFIRVVHTTGGRPLIGHSLSTINNSTTIVGHRKANSINLNSPLVDIGQTYGETTNMLTHLMLPYYTKR